MKTTKNDAKDEAEGFEQFRKSLIGRDFYSIQAELPDFARVKKRGLPEKIKKN